MCYAARGPRDGGAGGEYVLTLQYPEGARYIAKVLPTVKAIAPEFADYVLSVHDSVVIDRKRLSDRVLDDGTVYFLRSWSGG